jgi:uncharacterized protein YbbK (DUF523 family)
MDRTADRQPARVLVSSCLLGAEVRYNGGGAAVESDILQQWQVDGRIIPICPEVAGGLGVPRPPAEIAGGDGRLVLAGAALVRTKDGVDVTGAYLMGAEHAVILAKHYRARVAVLKSRSPSCGIRGIYDGTFTQTLTEGMGVTAAALRESGVRVFDETQLQEANAVLAFFDNEDA